MPRAGRGGGKRISNGRLWGTETTNNEEENEMTKRKCNCEVWIAPETKRIGNDEYELLGGNPDSGFGTKIAAQRLAREWLSYPADGHARVINMHGRYYVYGN
jgi:hypothetical protein